MKWQNCHLCIGKGKEGLMAPPENKTSTMIKLNFIFPGFEQKKISGEDLFIAEVPVKVGQHHW